MGLQTRRGIRLASSRGWGFQPQQQRPAHLPHQDCGWKPQPRPPATTYCELELFSLTNTFKEPIKISRGLHFFENDFPKTKRLNHRNRQSRSYVTPNSASLWLWSSRCVAARLKINQIAITCFLSITCKQPVRGHISRRWIDNFSIFDYSMSRKTRIPGPSQFLTI